MKNINKLQHFIFVVMLLGSILLQSHSAEAVSSIGESNAFSIYTINVLADVNRALSLYGEGYVKVPSTPSLTSFSDQMTIETWVKCDLFSAPHNTFVHKQGGSNNDVWVGVRLGDGLMVILRINEVEENWVLGKSLSLNKWYHVSVVYNSGNCKVYLNGEEIGSKTYSGNLTFDDKNWFIGVDTDGSKFNDYLDGLIDDVRVWKIARTQEQIRATMNEKLQGNEDGLVAYFSFNDGTGYDSSQQSGNHGTLMGDAELVTLYGPWPQPKIGDVSGNDEITAHDAALILQYVVGLISQFPADSMVSPSAIEPRDYEISLPNVETSPDGKIQVPISINDATGLLAGGITVKYDQTVLRATDVLCGGILSRSRSEAEGRSGFSYWRKNTDLDGEVRFAFASGESPTESGRMLVIEFDVLPHAEGKTSPLIFEDVNLSNSRSIKKINGEVRVIPSTFLLLQNFPNPFNPDTWLPYQLASASPVSISIYNAKGQLIRTLHLGYQNAGAYVTKGKAAYWDGKDNIGENVASGVYFYTLRIERQREPDKNGVEEFRYTRKMAIMK